MLRIPPALLRPLPLLLAIACGGSGGSSGGSIGNDAVTRGVVSATGSATVAGTTYATGSAEVFFDGVLGSELGLLPGMSVRVEGTRTGDGSQGDASRVDAEDAIEGPIDMIIPDALTTRKRLDILGQVAVVEDGFTDFGGGIDFDSIAEGDVVEVYGYRSGSGVISATRADFVSTDAMPEVELTGTVENLDTGTQSFEIDGIFVDYMEPGTVLPDGVPEDGDVVEVQGVFDGVDTIDATTSADRIVVLTPDAGDVSDYELVGIVSGFSSLNEPFQVDGQTVDASGLSVLFQPQPGSFVADGVLVEIEGSLVGGTVFPSIVILRSDGGRVSARIAADATDDVEQTLTLLEDILVETDASTRYVGCAGFAQLDVGDFSDVRVVVYGTRVVATEIACEAPDDDGVRVVGRVRGFDGSFDIVNILGLDVHVDPDAVNPPMPDMMNPDYYRMFPGDPFDDTPGFFSYLTSNDTVRLEVLDADMDLTTLDEADSVRWAEDD